MQIEAKKPLKNKNRLVSRAYRAAESVHTVGLVFKLRVRIKL